MYVLYHIFRWLFALRNCSKSCGEGVSAGSSTRHRVEAITAAFGGADCEGSTLQHQRCNDQPCPIDCEWKDLGPKMAIDYVMKDMVNIWLMIVNGIISWYNIRGKCVENAMEHANLSTSKWRFFSPNQTPNRIEAQIRLKENHNSFLQDWTAWTECVQPCGGEGSRQRSRNSTEAMHGGEDKGHGETSIGLILAETLRPWKTKIAIWFQFIDAFSGSCGC